MSRFAPIFVIIAAGLWGIDGIVLRPALYGLPVVLVVFIESVIVALILTPFFRNSFSKMGSLGYGDWLAFAGVALLGGAIGTMAITKALFYVNFVNLSIVVLIQKLQPVFAISFAAIFLREKLSKAFFFWAAFAISGAYLMTFGLKMPVSGGSDKTVMAALFALVATMSFAASTVLSKRALKNVGFGLGTYLRFLITSLFMLLIVLVLGDYSEVASINQKQVMVFVIIAFSTGGPAIFLYYYGLKRIRASVATICELSFPLTAVLLEYFIRQNIMSGVQWVGVAALLLAIIKVSGLRAKRDKEPSPRSLQGDGTDI